MNGLELAGVVNMCRQMLLHPDIKIWNIHVEFGKMLDFAHVTCQAIELSRHHTASSALEVTAFAQN
jgi:hypothetical protein